MAKKTANPTDKHVGSKIRQRRMMLDMTQTDLATGLGLTFQQVQKYEKGSNRVGASRLQHIASIMQVPVSFFFDGGPAIPGQVSAPGGVKPSPAFVQDFLATSDGIALVRAYMAIKDTKLRRSIVNFVEQIVSAKEA